MSTPPPFLPSSRHRPCGAGGKVPSPNAETSARRRGRRHANARPSSCVGERIASLRDFSYRPRRARRKNPQLSRENCGLTPKKRPTFARELRDFVPRRCAGQRNSESTVRQRAGERSRMRVALRGRRGQRATAPLLPSHNETMGCRRATGSTTKRPSPLESRKGRSGAALNGGQLTLRQRDSGRGQDLRSNSWRFSRRLVSRNS